MSISKNLMGISPRLPSMHRSSELVAELLWHPLRKPQDDHNQHAWCFPRNKDDVEGATFPFVDAFIFEVDFKKAWVLYLNLDIGKIM